MKTILKYKYFIITLLAIIFILTLSSISCAETVEYTATSTINGEEITWEYQLNDNNEITDLICKNINDLTGDITIPNSLDGKTVTSIGGNAFKSAVNITGVTIPDSVKEIENSAFNGCTNLKNIDLGSITYLSFDVFEGCTSLTSITIPKTLKYGSISPCFNNTNITSITLEDGLTVVPSYLCANTGITEITIPNSVKEIGYSAFDNCLNLKKITILDNVTDMGFYNIDNKDSVFKNHDSDLTIYCYKDSFADKYATKYDIKRQYLTIPSPDVPADDTANVTPTPTVTPTSNQAQTTPTPTTTVDTTTAKGVLPQTGETAIIFTTILLILGAGAFTYIKIKNYKDVK